MSGRLSGGIAMMLMTGALGADDLQGADRFICSAVEATQCTAHGDCTIGPPWDWKFPQFLEVDLKQDMLATTAASGENRSTPILNKQRSEGRIMFQGMQLGRAFSAVIGELSGEAAIAVAGEGMTLTVFAACTPLGKR